MRKKGVIMSSLVLDLQQEILKSDCDILNALRKAHLIASKLNLIEFDNWIKQELNGYSFDDETIPEYRKIKGVLKAFNPYNGWITAQLIDDEIEEMICELKLWQSIGEIKELYNEAGSNDFICQFSAKKMQAISSLFQTPIPMQYALHVSTHLLKAIIERVKNCLLEWTMKLEKEGILGEDMKFSKEETKTAEIIPQQINYYGTVINGDVDKSQVISGDNNIISFSYESAADLITKIKESIETESLSAEDKESTIELIDEAENKIKAQKKPGIIKAALSGWRDFLVATGANVTGTLIGQYLKGM